MDEKRITKKQEDHIRSLINRRRRQILVHSVIYYKYNENLVNDAQWADWGIELEQLQHDYPTIASECVYAEDFKHFDHSSGYDLPLGDPWARGVAEYLLQINGRKV